jgi:aspartyl-tRNA(Asn)/glutamyl-tRNA(Gln) amidotransferase subunit C
MLLNKSDIDKIAWLARLAIAENDVPNYTRDLSNILNLVEQMDQVDTGAIEALAHPLEIPARLRPDEITETDQRDHFQQIAPAVKDGHYLVPKVIE